MHWTRNRDQGCFFGPAENQLFWFQTNLFLALVLESINQNKTIFMFHDTAIFKNNLDKTALGACGARQCVQPAIICN